MFIKDFLNDINLTKVDIIYLTILLLFSLYVTIHLISVNMTLNLKSDVIIYLTNALYYAGLSENIHHTSTLYLSPVICFLTGKLMAWGITGKESIFYVTGFFSIMANVAMYIFLKYRFNRLLSLFGAILFGSFNVVLTYWANGTLDVSVISLSIWTVVFIILAVYENPKYYIFCFPLLVLSIFTRYSALFMLPLIMLYFFSQNDFFNSIDLLLYDRREFKAKSIAYLKSRDFIYLMIGIIIAAILFFAICNFITSSGSGLTFITQASDSLNGFKGTKYNESFAYQSNNTFYVENFIYMLNFDSIQAFGIDFSKIIMILIVISTSIHMINLTINWDVVREFKTRKSRFRIRNFDRLLWILLAICTILFIYGLTSSHLLANASMLVAMVIIFSLLDKYPISKKFYSMNMLCLAWFLVYFIFYSMISIKTYRYMISCIPPFVYFTVWALDSILRTVQDGFETNEEFIKKHQLNRNFNFANSRKGDYLIIIVIVLIAILMVHAALFSNEYVFGEYDNSKLDKVFDYFLTNDTNYTNLNISTDNSYYANYGTWYLQKDVVFNKTLFNYTPKDQYIVKNHKVENLTGYKAIVKTDRVRLYVEKDYYKQFNESMSK